MANFSYPVSSIVGGVSNMEYAVRLDSQATDQENCLLSSRYGLAKRPNTNYLATIKTEDGNAAADDLDCVIHPIHYGEDTRILVGFRGDTGNAAGDDFSTSTTEKWVLFDENGLKNVITHFPASSDATTPAIAAYPNLSEDPDTSSYLFPEDITFATIGDYTFINHAGVRPSMSPDVWKGYQETYESTSAGGHTGYRTIENNEVFAIWIKAHVMGLQQYSTNIDFNGTLFSGSIETDKDDSSSTRYYSSTSSLMNDTKAIAGTLAYQISGATSLEATALGTQNFSTANSAVTGGTSVITGRVFDDLDPNENEGVNFIPSLLHSVSAEAGRASTNVEVTFDVVSGISKLAPRSWEDHTVKISDSKDDGGDAFYMRFINDESSTITFTQSASWPSSSNRAFGAHTSFGSDNYSVNSSTTKLPRKGHWEEYCGVGVETTIDSATMPHVLFRRSDGSFVMMEARGDFQVNTVNDQVVFTASSNRFTVELDAGFSDDGTTGTTAGASTMGIIVGDTIQFDMTSADTFPPELKEDTDYFVKELTRSGRTYTMRVATSKGGDTVTFASDATITDCVVRLTTYSIDTWTPRGAGDDTTNPLPDLFYRKINKIFTYQNRLGFLSDKEVWFSGSGDPFTLFRSTVRDLLDDDPFGVSPTDSRGDIIKDAVGFGQNLVVFTNEAQHIVRALDGRFTAKTVEIVPAAHVTCDFRPHPIVVKDSLFFTFSTTESGGVWELAPSATRNNTWRTTDVSAHVPGYLPKGARTLAGSSKHGMLFYFNNRPRTSESANTDDTGHADYGKDQNIYVYTFMDGEGGRVQSAWTKWPLNADKETGHTDDAISATGYRIVNAAVVSDRLYLVTSTKTLNTGGGGVYDTEFYLEYMDLDLKTSDSIISDEIKGKFSGKVDGPSTAAVVMLDRRVDNSLCVEQWTGITMKISPPWKFDASMKDSLEVITASGQRFTEDMIVVSVSAPTATVAGMFKINGVDLTDEDYWIGYGYEMKSVLGAFAPRVQNTPLRGRNIYVRGARMTYTMATEFTVSVDHGGTTYTDTVTADTTTDTTSGEMYFGIRKHMPDLSVTISNSNPFNAMFQGIMYDLNVQEVLGG